MSDWFDLPDPVIAALRAKLQEAEVEKDQLRMDRDRLQSQVDICYYKDSVKEIARLQAEVARLKDSATCSCGDVFNAGFKGVCPNCLAGEDSELRARIAELEAAMRGLMAGCVYSCIQGVWHWHERTTPPIPALDRAREALDVKP